jgi:hypothetical protein
MKAGYKIDHLFNGDALGDKHIDIAHIINWHDLNTVIICYHKDGYKPNLNIGDTVAIFKIKPKK